MRGTRVHIALMPSTLRARLTLTIVLASILLFVLVFSVAMIAVRGSVYNRWVDAPYVLPLTLGLVSMLLGLALGTVLSGLICKPIEQFVGYMENQGQLAVEGLPFEQAIEVDANLPEELVELGNVIQDLLARLQTRQAELRLANDHATAAEQALRTVVNDSAEAKMLIREGAIDVANPAAAACLGVRLESMHGQQVSELFSAMTITTEIGDAITIGDLVELAEGRALTVQFMSPRGEHWMRVSVSRSIGLDALLLTARDVTEEHHLEAIRAEIVSLISHDLRAPLAVISGYLQVLARPLNVVQREKAVMAAGLAADRMVAMIAGLLDASRAETLLAPAVMRPVILGELVDDAAGSVRVASGRTVIVTKRREATVLGDELRLRQALENLLGNAVKHTPDGSDITISLDADDRQATVSVSDQGDGIPEEYRAAVFERFARLGVSRGINGAGLGLYIVRVIAESHGGTASVSDAEGGGACFTVELPLLGGTRLVIAPEDQSEASLSA